MPNELLTPEQFRERVLAQAKEHANGDRELEVFLAVYAMAWAFQPLSGSKE